jgi:glutamyl-tRNA synthetase
MTNPSKPARVRFAPSPTGHMHLGSARTALYDYLLAQQTGGQFILRIEDTDQKRTIPGAEQEMMDGLRWLGMNYDEGPDIGGAFGPYRQTERKDYYISVAQALIDKGFAYYCFCTPDRLSKMREEQQKNKLAFHYDGTCRGIDPDEAARRKAKGEPCVIRFKTPQQGTTTVTDLLRGAITVDNQTIDDFVLLKTDGWALYHLAAISDDNAMKITHVIRGSEWLPTLPLHAMIHRAMGWEEPAWVHLSVFLKPSGAGKMSKRDSADLLKDGYSIFIKDLKDLGYTPEGVINWISLMGWSLDDHTEYFSMRDLVEKFNIERLNPTPAAINFSKLDHFNGLHIRNFSTADLAGRIKSYFEKAGYSVSGEVLLKITPLIRERLTTLDEAPLMAGFFFKDTLEYNPSDLIAKKLTALQSVDVARKAYAILSSLPDVKLETAEPPMRKLVEELGFDAGQVFGILRVAVTGQKVSPPLFESIEIIGKAKTLERVQNAIRFLETLL